ncbi:MAG: hypothetical protein HZA49_01290 [Planctomycetes bacterium]|nr:hypothetical protein [Planctomycetota bacterium]
MTNKALYLIIGILVGVIAVLATEKSAFNNNIFAAPDKASETSANNNYIAIGSMTRTDNNLLWLIDTANKKLLVYEYAQDYLIRVRAARDIQYDLNIPDGVAMPASPKLDEGPPPIEIKKIYDDIRKRQEKR